MGKNLGDAFLKSGMIAATIFELVSEGLGFVHDYKAIIEPVNNQINTPDIAIVRSIENPRKSIADILTDYDLTGVDAGDLSDAKDLEDEEKKEKGETRERETPAAGSAPRLPPRWTCRRQRRPPRSSASPGRGPRWRSRRR